MAGLYFEDFKVGTVYQHETARSVTEFDNIWASFMQLNTQPLHSNFDFVAKNTQKKKPLFNSLYTLGIITGQASQDLTRGTLLETLLLDEIDFPRSVYAGDTLYSRTTVTSLDGSSNHNDAGIVELFHEGLNQDSEIVASFKRKLLIRKRNVAAWMRPPR
ncbi:MAG: MaoC family dehydratase [Georgfuchsia sp.]